MAIISKIRERAGIAVGAIAIGLILFIVGGDLFSSNSWIMQSLDQPKVGTIDGNDITFQEYNDELNDLKNKYSLRVNRSLNESELEYIRPEAFNNLVYKLVIQKEFEKIGINITPEELQDMIQGNNLNPSWAQSFTNPQTGEVDKNMIINFLKNISQAAPEQQAQFYSFEQDLVPERSKEKYQKLFDLSTYITKKEAENYYKEQNARVGIKYVAIPFFLIPDSAVKVTDELLKAQFEKNKAKYAEKENRSIEYVPFSFKPSSIDSATIKKGLEDLVTQFASTTENESFANANSDVNQNIGTLKSSELPKDLTGVTLEDGKVYGPFLDKERGVYALHKFIGTAEDTVFSARASHILFSTQGKAETEKADVKKKAQEVLNQLKNSGADFASLARIYGEDGTREKGGDLGWFAEKQMVAPFEKAVMDADKEGVVPNLVETEFGYHIIDVTGLKNKAKYKLATIIKEIVPSDATREKAYRDASNFATAKNIKEYVDKVGAAKLISLQALNIAKDAKYINNLTSPKIREIVRWAYNDAELGQVSPIFELEDQYLVAVLRGAVNKGEATWEDVKDELSTEVRNDLKAQQIMDKLKSVTQSDLTAIANAYGTNVSVTTMSDVTLQSSALNGLGYAPVAIGKAFAMKKGERTSLFRDESGIIALEVTEVSEATEVADYNSYKEQLVGRRTTQTLDKLYKALKKITKTESDLAKFF
ncbi:MAG: SurA N-terminal domain-containing protein [Thermoflexibacter sp.]|jgi:peptidyl-prolyl cis-trans isomerase D|nr:SurA N-terminal domain-containing protein [Thermoflexibacter sp.]